MNSSKRPLVVLLVIAGVAALLWWMRGDPSDEPDSHVAGADVAAAGRAGGRDTPKAKPRRPRESGLAFHQAPKASVSGTVYAEGEGPLQGARVCAFVIGDEVEKPREVPCVVTTADGRYRIDGLLAARYDVTAGADEHLAGRYRAGRGRPVGVRLAAGQQRTDLDITLAPGGVQVFGTVRDISGGEIPGAQVRRGWPGGAADPPVTAIADDEGNFSMWVRRGRVDLEATAEGYGTERQGGRSPGTHFELYLTPESVVVGRVVDVATDEPVAGARVKLGWQTVITDAKGAFRFEGLDPGAYKPKATADEGYGEAEASVHLGVGETSEEVLVRLHPAVTVSGTLVVREAEETRPCEDGGATLTPIPAAFGERHRATVEAEGTVHVRGVLPGRYEITVHCRGHVAEDGYGEIDVADASIDGLVWEVTRGATIRGKVVGDPKVVARASVRARSVGGAARSKRSRTSDPDLGDDGSFVLTGLRPNTYKVTVRGPEIPTPEEPLEVEVAAGEELDGVELEVLPGATIVGRVEDADGNPISRADVRAEGPGRSWSFEPVDDDGRFEIRGLRGGEYRVRASLTWSESLRKPGSNDDDVQGELVSVEPGETGEVTLVVEARNRSIAGVVVDGSGGPVPDAFVRAERVSDSKAANENNARKRARWGGWNEKPIMTETDGSFTIEGLSEGTYTVWAFRRGGGEGYVESVAVGSDGVTVQIKPTGRIEGRVETASGGVPRRFSINIQDEATGFRRDDSFFATDGSFVMDELPPGSFFVAANSAEGSGDTEITLEEGAAQTGVKIELQKMVSVKGKVVDLETGEPVPGINVSMARKKGGRFNVRFSGADKRNITDDAGKYELDAVPVGPVSVTLIPKTFIGDEADYGFTQRRLTVEDASPFEVPDIEMVRRRVKKSEDVGDLGYTLKQPDPGTEWTERQLIVGFVRPGGPAAEAGLEIGDEIRTIDGHDVTGDRIPTYYTLSAVPIGSTVELGLEGGKSVKVKAGKKP